MFFKMAMSIEIHHPRADELTQTRRVAADVMAQVYRDLLGGRSLVAETLEPWANSWIATVNGEIVGVGMSSDDLVSDLWLLPQSRGHRIGSRILTLLEAEVRERGYAQARLRVVADNTAARGFYCAHGWCEADRFDHEKLGFAMLNMYKRLNRCEGETS